MEKLAIVGVHTFEVDERSTIAAQSQSFIRIKCLAAVGAVRPHDGSEWGGCAIGCGGPGIGFPRLLVGLGVRSLTVMGIGAIRVNRNLAMPAEVNGLIGIDGAATLRANRIRWRMRRWAQDSDPPAERFDPSLARM